MGQIFLLGWQGNPQQSPMSATQLDQLHLRMAFWTSSEEVEFEISFKSISKYGGRHHNWQQKQNKVGGGMGDGPAGMKLLDNRLEHSVGRALDASDLIVVCSGDRKGFPLALSHSTHSTHLRSL